MKHSSLIDKYLLSSQLLTFDSKAQVLDLACGEGRNGLHVLENDINVVFADINGESLKQVEQAVNRLQLNTQKLAQYWQVDFEQDHFDQVHFDQGNDKPLKAETFDAIMVFRYLHRPLMTQIKAAVKPGGMIIYETFTEKQAKLGRPKNSNFLLKPNELLEYFSDWKILYSFEGEVFTSQGNHAKQAIAQIVAIKPE
ncbi:class I SAM-dependent methyltransferase [Colwellia sp. 4_MG-2023]|uniref:class I SAM-dependent methyltransferase n=1 Tax=unclassified Colwellia TaxID=196834 RepID=UPI0026E2A4B9|nr:MULTISPECIES: class I SAM-dependent methyltransferase [unclassified Colwellia]MDO6506114.1 class I SAM-dependent methyltransferase [Colwellia sp. 5_MG-2023]MDO6554826.1 class I SAM-dependent methyltransferase [Colwellia sp. 4_MG-2023]